jgi:hypothetical protein
MSDKDGVVASAPILPEGGLPLGVQQRFDDVPLPLDVREDLERTYIYESKMIQVARMVYTSKASVNELAQFYIQECPVADWKLQSVLQAEGVELLFEKPGKRLLVEVRGQEGVGRSRLLILRLEPLPGAGGQP